MSLNVIVPSSLTILVVDDDTSIRALVESILRDEGFITMCAHDGLEALQISREHQGPIHLLVSDIMMPRMDGLQLSKCLATERPETPMLFISGGADALELGENLEYLPKPFKPDVLLLRVRQLLDCIVKTGALLSSAAWKGGASSRCSSEGPPECAGITGMEQG